MALQSFQLDPNAGGVSQTEFDSHTHNYRKITRVGVDASDNWSSPTWTNIVDNSDNYASESVDLEAAGVTVVTSPTSTPV